MGTKSQCNLAYGVHVLCYLQRLVWEIHVQKTSLIQLLFMPDILYHWKGSKVTWPLQGVSFEILLFQMAVAQKWYIFDPMLVKPKLVWEAVVFCVRRKFFKNEKNTVFQKSNCYSCARTWTLDLQHTTPVFWPLDHRGNHWD